MAIINQATKELQVKIVYYGPPMGGKTTNLVQVHDHVQTAAGNKGKLVSLATSSDARCFFDFLPIRSDVDQRVSKRNFSSIPVPGQVILQTPPDNGSFAESMASFSSLIRSTRK